MNAVNLQAVYLPNIPCHDARVTDVQFTADYSNDLYRYDPTTLKWTALFPSGTIPSKREFIGFTATPDGKLYTFGGTGYTGDERVSTCASQNEEDCVVDVRYGIEQLAPTQRSDSKVLPSLLCFHRNRNE